MKFNNYDGFVVSDSSAYTIDRYWMPFRSVKPYAGTLTPERTVAPYAGNYTPARTVKGFRTVRILEGGGQMPSIPEQAGAWVGFAGFSGCGEDSRTFLDCAECCANTHPQRKVAHHCLAKCHRKFDKLKGLAGFSNGVSTGSPVYERYTATQRNYGPVSSCDSCGGDPWQSWLDTWFSGTAWDHMFDALGLKKKDEAAAGPDWMTVAGYGLVGLLALKLLGK